MCTRTCNFILELKYVRLPLPHLASISLLFHKQNYFHEYHFPWSPRHLAKKAFRAIKIPQHKQDTFLCMFNPLQLSRTSIYIFEQWKFERRRSLRRGKLPKTNNSSNELHCLKFLQILLNLFMRKVIVKFTVLLPRPWPPSLEKKREKVVQKKILAYFPCVPFGTNWGTRFAVNSLAPPPPLLLLGG
ncbi:hypothetical protein CEXT_371211 [Caerostris extrusa]|uniref:Uncharacterized protein n=1 Tax=Caerostris extrusa TaxID=172846 RepID=A0AAV4SUV1_CAEEX|nr:hypothetical protein CEXT_371211 [Caerostris extrusa]